MPNTKDIKDKPSPEWLLAELEKLGYKSFLQPKEARLAEPRWMLKKIIKCPAYSDIKVGLKSEVQSRIKEIEDGK